MHAHPRLSHPLARRVVLRAGSLLPLGLGTAVLVACGGENSSSSAQDSPEEQESSSSQEDSSQESSQDSQGSGGVSFSAEDVPVGGATYDESTDTIYSQPTEGEFVAFDATCPHQGCAVSKFVDAELECPCHGSRFDPATGEVLGGPATSGLKSKKVTVEGDDLVVG